MAGRGNARIPYRVFSDQEIYREELTRIFLGPTWQFLTLANELLDSRQIDTVLAIPI